MMGQHVRRAFLARRLFDLAANLQTRFLLGGVILAVQAAAAQFGIAEEEVAGADVQITHLTVNLPAIKAPLGQPAVEFRAAGVLERGGQQAEQLLRAQGVILLDALEHLALELQLLPFRRRERGRLQRLRQDLRRAFEIAGLTQSGGAVQRLRGGRSGLGGEAGDGKENKQGKANSGTGFTKGIRIRIRMKIRIKSNYAKT